MDRTEMAIRSRASRLKIILRKSTQRRVQVADGRKLNEPVA